MTVCVRAGRKTIQEIAAACLSWEQFRVSNQPNVEVYKLQEEIAQEEC